MSHVKPNFSGSEIARRHLDVAESWQADHDGAMECRDFESWLIELTGVFDMIHHANMEVRHAARSASDADLVRLREPADIGKTLYEIWRDKTAVGAADLPDFEGKYGKVEGADAFRERRRLAETTLAAWTPPARWLSPGMHLWEVTPEEAEQIDAIMKAPPGSPGKLNFKPTPTLRGDASLIR